MDQKLIQIEEEELKTQDPGFWDSPKEAEQQMRVIRGLKQWTDAFQKIDQAVEDLLVLYEFHEAGEATDQDVDDQFADTLEAIENLETKNMLRREEDKLGAVMKINAGAGGTEANDWAEMLMRMYIRWAEQHGYKVRESSMVPGEDAGVKNVTLEIDGEYAYGYLKSENGVHRLVRISLFR